MGNSSHAASYRFRRRTCFYATTQCTSLFVGRGERTGLLTAMLAQELTGRKNEEKVKLLLHLAQQSNPTTTTSTTHPEKMYFFRFLFKYCSPHPHRFVVGEATLRGHSGL